MTGYVVLEWKMISHSFQHTRRKTFIDLSSTTTINNNKRDFIKCLILSKLKEFDNCT